jgi:hypothetical protein
MQSFDDMEKSGQTIGNIKIKLLFRSTINVIKIIIWLIRNPNRLHDFFFV